jgi:hypothetical protein
MKPSTPHPAEHATTNIDSKRPVISFNLLSLQGDQGRTELAMHKLRSVLTHRSRLAHTQTRNGMFKTVSNIMSRRCSLQLALYAATGPLTKSDQDGFEM